MRIESVEAARREAIRVGYRILASDAIKEAERNVPPDTPECNVPVRLDDSGSS
jgi:hypothetical protein